MKCWICGAEASDRHHVFNGPMRKKSEEFGAVIPLCRVCHDRIHNEDAKERLELKAEFQRQIMQNNGWDEDEFRKEFRKSYL